MSNDKFLIYSHFVFVLSQLGMRKGNLVYLVSENNYY